ncbi:MAG TPA: pilus assembly PilX N-terminal domain-containing protein [Smithellaceae bacterium]|jgi:hypothetical protein|nr:pilus assembly PilX N-terminal domain-containing protein [Smithellaceae bacterium]HOQ71230.1 pilus assembly PilX N-terminal domain-containing protein [Smithellaceae bacterium]
MKNINIYKIMGNEKGMVMVIVLMLVAVLVILGTTGILTVTTDMKISSNYRENARAFYNAEAGAESVLAVLRTWTKANYPTSVGTPVTINLTVPSGFAFSSAVQLYYVADNLYKFQIQGTGYNNASKVLEIYVKYTDPLPGGALAAVQANSAVENSGNMDIDGRDYDISGNLITPVVGTKGVSSKSTVSTGGAGAIGGVDSAGNVSAPAKTPASGTVEQNATWTPPLTPDAALKIDEGTLKKIAKSGVNGSQYVTNPDALVLPLSGVTYVEADNWQAVNFGNSSGILIVHNASRSAVLKNTNGGTFKGIMIIDDYVHEHNDMLGCVITLSTSPSSGNVLGNGNGYIHYSTAAIGAALALVAGPSKTSWRDVQ